MADLGQLERAKRRRLQEAYGDLRPAQGGPDRQAKLRDLLTGAMADAGASAALGSGSAAGAAGGPASVEATQALAAAAAANLAAVVSTDKRRPLVTGRRAAATAAAAAAGSAGLATTSGWAGPGGAGSPAAAWASPWGAARAGSAVAGGATAPNGTAGSCSRAGGGGGGANAQRAPPPGPMAGGFIPDTDPITRLSQLPTAVAVLQRSVTPGGGKSGSLRIAAGLAARLAAGGSAAGATPGGGGGTAAALAAAAEAAAAARADAEEDAILAAAELPSDIELALMSLRADFRAHAACAALPPLALRSQLAAAGLRDRGSVERQLDEQRQAGRVRLFRLPTGKDEFGILLTSDYRDIVRRAADAAAAAAAAAGAGAGAGASARVSAGGGGATMSLPASFGFRAPAADGGQAHPHQQQAGNGFAAADPAAAAPAARVLSYGAYGSAEDYETPSAHHGHAYGNGGSGSGTSGGGGGGGGHAARAAAAAGGGATRRDSKWHTAAEVFLGRVVDRYNDFELSSDHLLRLLRLGPGLGAAAGSSTPGGQAGAGGGGAGTPAASRHAPAAGAGEAAAGPCTAAEAEDVVSLLLHLGCLGRHTDGDADAYVMAVPGAGKVVKSVADGRRELLMWLSKRQHQEAPEKTICELRLQRSCLPPLYHIRDLVGRGSARRIEAAVGPMIKLTPLGVAAAAAAAAAGKKPATGARRRQQPS
ncbi:hypothetical protein HXX76_010675 [Chlamydomonas incerta]|uniref:Uncharacterized protein n=1 Tax=Chlamydomonas incerta TaxID=51695 RepID=A0A835VVX7_CHLIN|nr:hypothetical protein HXX76_010675 [Chlamydomonas incerta]|eukprot:KAG2429895.1 hypothetical protein HXX76_010675 [Chlamydomonas incerta]